MTNTGYDFADRAGLQAWLRAQSGDNSQRRQRLLRNLPRAVAAELTPRQREILALYIDRGMTMSQIAQQLRINKSTVSRSLRRTFQRLRRCLEYSLQRKQPGFAQSTCAAGRFPLYCRCGQIAPQYYAVSGGMRAEKTNRHASCAGSGAGGGLRPVAGWQRLRKRLPDAPLRGKRPDPLHHDL